jgi:hypothetical protein
MEIKTVEKVGRVLHDVAVNLIVASGISTLGCILVNAVGDVMRARNFKRGGRK